MGEDFEREMARHTTEFVERKRDEENLAAAARQGGGALEAELQRQRRVQEVRDMPPPSD
ncbi:hypothetical protein FraEuI1c_6848 [Pseudofrankia inefficax]|uniref:Uncharacterized protein n=1 Tax=Pseudofrankia inefficax (strain DSM 45817 / CECT 9037 / DDB 130130 / EuI1c) TaxID=298654 RepID=E3JDQ1_PSEI1|nr:hypothetical protein FraEuI1c_6848 [Pseudofrankia inefficax]